MSILGISSLSKHYNKHYVLQDITLRVDSGQIIGYIGPNGAGKSTTIKILTGIISEFEGDVSLLGMDIRQQANEIKQRIGYVPEQAALYEVLTPMEYLHFLGRLYRLDRKITETKAKELLHLFGLSDQLHNRMNNFSKGMRQKVLLIAGMIHNPEIIFLDEPLSGLDANAVILVKEILAKLKQAGKTIFYSSHIMDVVERICDRIIIINGGRIIADGTFESLQQQGKQGSLETIFTALTGNEEHITTAGRIMDVLKN